jgi:hypothetical protein
MTLRVDLRWPLVLLMRRSVAAKGAHVGAE